jgi:uncharacterized membrane protein YbjE (DUF340 family)
MHQSSQRIGPLRINFRSVSGVKYFSFDLLVRKALIRVFQCDYLPQKYTEGIYIGGLVIGLIQSHFWRHVSNCARVTSELERRVLIDIVGIIFRRETEIKNLDIVTNIKPNIVWFQIAINDTVGGDK